MLNRQFILKDQRSRPGAPVKTGRVQRVGVPYAEGLATHSGSESCVYIRKSMGEALTGGVQAGY